MKLTLPCQQRVGYRGRGCVLFYVASALQVSTSLRPLGTLPRRCHPPSLLATRSILSTLPEPSRGAAPTSVGGGGITWGNTRIHHSVVHDFSATTQKPSAVSSKENDNRRSTWLVVGDGDLSYSASIAPTLEMRDIQLIATVLEDEETHQKVFRNSKNNSNIVNASDKANVCFGIDATKLIQHFEPNSLDRIIFNFPHWRGKNNHRYNRILVQDFLSSTMHVLKEEDGEVHMALRRGQSGLEATNLQEWRDSWLVPMLANDAGLLLDRVEPFRVGYNVSSHRGVDRPFPIGEIPRRYVFRMPSRDGHKRDVDPEYQMACRHELRIVLEPNVLEKVGCGSMEELVKGEWIMNFLREHVLPSGIDAEIPLRDVTDVYYCYLMVYRGSSQPLTREQADEIRQDLEHALDTRLGLLMMKRNYMVSKPFPYRLMEQLLKEHNNI